MQTSPIKPTIKQPKQTEFHNTITDQTSITLIFDSPEHLSDWLYEVKDIARREGHIEGLAAYKQKVRNFVLEILND